MCFDQILQAQTGSPGLRIRLFEIRVVLKTQHTRYLPKFDDTIRTFWGGWSGDGEILANRGDVVSD